MKYAVFLIVILLIPFAHAKTVEFADATVEYDNFEQMDTTEDGYADRTSYYLNEELVATGYDTNKDGEFDIWFTWDDDKLESIEEDRDLDGEVETAIEYDSDERPVREEINLEIEEEEKEEEISLPSFSLPEIDGIDNFDDDKKERVMELLGYVTIMLFAGLFIKRLSKHRKTSPDEALKTLKMRYAKGEISKKEFNEMKKELKN